MTDEKSAAAQVEETVAAWTARLRQGLSAKGARKRSSDPMELRELMAGLERDAEAVAADLARARNEVASWEARAIKELGLGNDPAAKEALLRCREHGETIERLEADLTVTTALIAECRDVLARTAPNSG
jgi:phage shock protein A